MGECVSVSVLVGWRMINLLRSHFTNAFFNGTWKVCMDECCLTLIEVNVYVFIYLSYNQEI